jgi:hypothetical protein
MVVFAKTDNGYTVTTGNVLPASAINDLKERLDEINKLDKKEIRSIYRQMLSTAEFSTKGGAGLGLLEMAKKTGNRLDYDFVTVDEEHSYFILSKTVDSGGVGMNLGGSVKPFNGESISQLERLMAENNIYLIWSGHISPDVGKEVLFFTETKLSEEDIESNLRRRVFSILIEILENVAKYSPGKEPEKLFGMPVALIRMEDKVYSLTTSNLIMNENVSHLQEKLDLINSYDKEGLKKLFKRSLLEQPGKLDSTGNMGLIDMARKSGSKLMYRFEKVNDLYSYYTLTVKVEERSD